MSAVLLPSNASQEAQMNRAIWGYALARFALFNAPVAVMFYAFKGLSFADFAIMMAIFKLSSAVLEVPSGYLSDHWSRKKVLLVGAACITVSWTAMCIGYGLWAITAAHVVQAMGYALFSGTINAWLKESLVMMGREGQSDITIWTGKLQSTSQLLEGLSLLVGSLLFALHPNLVVASSALAGVLGLFLISLVQLPEAARPTGKTLAEKYRQSFGGMQSVARYAMHEDKSLKWLIILSAIVFTGTIVMMWGWMEVLRAQGFNPAYMSLIMFPYFIVRYVVSKQTKALLDRWGEKRVFLSLVPIQVLGFAVVGMFDSLWLIIPAILTHGFVFAFGKVAFNAIVTHKAKAGTTATVLSVMSMAEMLFQFPFWLWMSSIIVLLGVHNAMLVAGVFIGATGVLAYARLIHHKVFAN